MNSKIVLAVSLSAIVGVWVASGTVFASDSDEEALTSHSNAQKLKSVIVQNFTAQDYTRHIDVVGRTQAEQAVTLASQTSGDVAQIYVEKGDVVKKGQALIQLNIASRLAVKAAAEAALKAAEADVKSSKALNAKGYQANLTLAQKEATLANAQRELKQVEQDIDYTTIISPFNGVVESLPIEVGSYLAPGSNAIRIMSTDKFLVVGNVAQQSRMNLKVGQNVTCELINGDIISGVLRFVSREADSQTQTYRVEVVINGEDYPNLSSGITARMSLPAEDSHAHLIPHSALVLGDEGVLGVKWVNNSSITQFTKVDYLADSGDGVWVAGLPDEVNVITRGQLNVASGEKVEISIKGK